MTLCTRIFLLDPINPREAFDFTADLLSPDRRIREMLDPWDDNMIGAEPGQGLAAWLRVSYAIDGPLRWEDEPPYVIPEHCVRVVVETGYGYTAANGARCDDLHAWIVSHLVCWGAERNLRVLWMLESEGTVHDIADLHLLGDPVRGALR